MQAPPLSYLAIGIVLAAGVFLVALAAMSLTVPHTGRQFLLAFARSPAAHFFELAVRFAVGLGFIGHAPHMAAGTLFFGFGWMLVITSVMLALLPWRWHRSFAQRFVPRATLHMPALGLASLLAGVCIFVAVAYGAPA
jgi:hypothetical protein